MCPLFLLGLSIPCPDKTFLLHLNFRTWVKKIPATLNFMSMLSEKFRCFLEEFHTQMKRVRWNIPSPHSNF